MDTETLVDRRINDGRKLLMRLAGVGFDVSVAFWAKTSDDGRWFLYIAAKMVDEKGLAAAYGEAYGVLQSMESPALSMFEVKLISPATPIATDAVRLRDRTRGSHPFLMRVDALGSLSVGEVYIYPVTRKADHKTRIIGCREVSAGGKTEIVNDEIGIVDGLVGEDMFNESYLRLIGEKFGGVDEFALRYPKFFLEILN